MTTATEPDRAAHESHTPSAAATWTALWLVYIIWGSTYLAIRVVVDQGLPPLLAMGARFLTAGLLMLTYVVIRRGWTAMRVTRRQLIACAVVGIALLGFGNGGVAIAEQNGAQRARRAARRGRPADPRASPGSPRATARRRCRGRASSSASRASRCWRCARAGCRGSTPSGSGCWLSGS